MKAMKAGIIILGRRRPGFDPEWGAHITARLEQSLAAELANIAGL